MKKLTLNDDRNRWLLCREYETAPGTFDDTDDLYHRLEVYNLVGIDDQKDELAVAKVFFLTFSDECSNYERGIFGGIGYSPARNSDPHIHAVQLADDAEIGIISKADDDNTFSIFGSHTAQGVTLAGRVNIHFSQVFVDGLVKDVDVVFSRIAGNVSITGSKVLNCFLHVISDEASIIATDYLENIVMDYHGEKGLKIIEPEDCCIVLSQEFYDAHKVMLSEYFEKDGTLQLLDDAAQFFNVPLQLRVRLSDDTYYYQDFDRSGFAADHTHRVLIVEKEVL